MSAERGTIKVLHTAARVNLGAAAPSKDADLVAELLNDDSFSFEDFVNDFPHQPPSPSSAAEARGCAGSSATVAAPSDQDTLLGAEPSTDPQPTAVTDCAGAPSVLGVGYAPSSPDLVPVLTYQEPAKGIAYQLWPAAIALCAFLENNRSLVASHRVLELGAGTGLLGLFAAQLGSRHVTITDLPEVVPHIRRNIAANVSCCQSAAGTRPTTTFHFPGPTHLSTSSEHTGSVAAVPRCAPSDMDAQQQQSPDGDRMPPLSTACCCGSGTVAPRVEAAALSWGDTREAVTREFGAAQVLLLADCVYWEHLFQPLLTTLALLAPRGSARLILLANVRRRKMESRFYKQLRRHFAVDEIERIRVENQKRHVSIYRATPLPLSPDRE